MPNQGKAFRRIAPTEMKPAKFKSSLLLALFFVAAINLQGYAQPEKYELENPVTEAYLQKHLQKQLINLHCMKFHQIQAIILKKSLL